jgi:diaminobutyrate-2-oxoglutarate transaminase
MFRGLRAGRAELAGALAARAFGDGLLLETSGARGDVLKIMPPIVNGAAALDEGLDELEELLRKADAEQAANPGEAR